MKFTKLFLPAILGLALVTTACQEGAMQQKNDETTGNTSAIEGTEKATGTLTWAGEYMVDGCGFTLEIDGKTYKPENEDTIDAAFKIEGSMPVEVEFVRLNEQIDRRCGLSPDSKAMDGIRIVSITKS